MQAKPGKLRLQKNNTKKILSVFLAVVLLFTASNFSVVAAANDDYATEEQKAELAELKEREQRLASEAAEIDKNMDSVKADISNLEQQSASLSADLESLFAEDKILQEEYDRLKAELDAAKEYMQACVAEYDQAIEDVENKHEEFEKRIVAMYKRGKQSKLEVLLNSDGITGFFTNLELLKVIAEKDVEILDELTAARETAKAKQIKAEQSKEQYEKFVASKADEIEKLAQGIRSKQDEISAVEANLLNRSASLSDLESSLADNESEQSNLSGRKNEINKQIAAQKAAAEKKAREEAARKAREAAERKAKAEAERKAKAEAERKAKAEAERKAKEEAEQEESGSGSSEGTTPAPTPGSGFTHPAPGNYRISSYYGYRVHPIFGYSRFHSGLDLPGNFNDPIVAAQSGVVEKVHYPYPNSNYGGLYSGNCNYIVVNHGNGLKTYYLHLKRIDVSPGQHVSRGQRIGGMGSTGYSTGCHLHFEVRVNGSTVDPYPYIY